MVGSRSDATTTWMGDPAGKARIHTPVRAEDEAGCHYLSLCRFALRFNGLRRQAYRLRAAR
jgi:hypothetical protein